MKSQMPTGQPEVLQNPNTQKVKSQTGLIAIGLGALLAIPASLAQEDLKSKVDRLEEELRGLKQQLADRKTAEDKKIKSAPTVTAGADGITIHSADTNFVFKIHGYVQADGRFYPGDANGTAPNDTFLLRRVRTIFEGSVFQDFDYRMMLDFGAGSSLSTANNTLVQDGYVTYHPWQGLQFQIGKYKAPVSLDRLQPDAYLTMVERSYTSELAPNRDVGFEVKGDLFDNRFSYAAGVFNGVGDNDSGDIEVADDEKDLEARVFATPFKLSKVTALQKLGFGLAGTIGNHEGPLRGFVTPGQQTFFSYNPANVGTNAVSVVADGEQWRLAPQGYYYIGPFGVWGEYVISSLKARKNNPTDFARFENRAWSVHVSYFLTGEENTWEPVKPKHRFSLSEGGYGAVQLVAQVQHIDLDNKMFPLYANPATSASAATSWGFGVNWLLNPNVKLSLNYENTDFKGGTSPFLQKGEQVIMTRAQVAF
jgi:phosphate-selective porin OprO/OprP